MGHGGNVIDEPVTDHREAARAVTAANRRETS